MPPPCVHIPSVAAILSPGLIKGEILSASESGRCPILLPDIKA